MSLPIGSKAPAVAAMAAEFRPRSHSSPKPAFPGVTARKIMKVSLARGWRLAPVVLVALGVSGCSSLYLYDAKRETATTAFSQDFGKLAFPEVADQQAYIRQLAQDETRQVTLTLMASRNARIATFVDPQKGAAPERLQREVEGRLKQILGTWPEGLEADPEARKAFVKQLQLMRGRPEAMWVHAVALSDFKTAFEGLREEYLKSLAASHAAAVDTTTGPALLCPDVLAAPVPALGDLSIYASMVVACRNLDRETHKNPLAEVTTKPGGFLPDALAAIATDEKAAAVAAANAKAIKADVEAAATPKRDGTESAQVAKAFANLKADAKDATDVAKALGAKSVADELNKWLALQFGTAAASGADAPPADVKRAQTLLDLASALIGAGDAAAGRTPEISAGAAQVALAGLQQRLDVAQLEAQHSAAVMQADQDRASALVYEMADLASAELALACGGAGVCAPAAPSVRATSRPALPWPSGPQGATALNAYASSWVAGRIPYEVAGYHVIQADRAYAAAKAAKTAQNWKSLLQPAVDRMLASAKGGIKPEQPAAFAAAIAGGALAGRR